MRKKFDKKAQKRALSVSFLYFFSDVDHPTLDLVRFD